MRLEHPHLFQDEDSQPPPASHLDLDAIAFSPILGSCWVTRAA
ncbi:hypothetical protein SLEP1_g39572 [Rubroshorea leprosula]|uniref:Uncharacterized protein n=1 Tax=Rubroshorea leprosula TaxID=152421 RepID=A0AAV5L0M0_9ROSI|nr:hypothetical protein SLEP1_g39572 [Rubroshorea leprosula]